MERFDKIESHDEPRELNNIERPRVKISVIENRKIIKLFIDRLNNLEFEDIKILDYANTNIVKFNNDIDLEFLRRIDSTVNNYDDFIRRYYYNIIDELIDEVFEMQVVSIVELPYSIQNDGDKVVKMEFLI